MLGIALLVAITVCAVAAPWSRWPAGVQAIPPLAFYLALALLRHATGGSISGLAPLAALPVVWLALYGTRGAVTAAATGCGLLFLAPTILLGEPSYPAADWRRGLLWTALSVVVGIAIRRLARSGERHAATLDALLDLNRRMDIGSPAVARAKSCELAGNLTGARLCVLMEPDGEGNLMSTAISGMDLPPIVLPLTGQVSGSVIAFTMGQRVFIGDASNNSVVSEDLVKATGVASMLFEPIRQDGRVIGVLCLGFSSVMAVLPRDDVVIVESIAQQFAATSTRVDLVTRLEALAADASDLVGRYVLVDGEFVVSYASPSAYTLLGRPPETLIGTSPMDIVHDDDRAVVTAAINVLGGRPPTTVAYRAAHADGRWIWVESTVRPVIDVLTGRVTEVQVTTRDIRDRKRMERELRRAHALSAGVLGAATDYSIIATDLDGIITVFNVGAERLLGYSAAEMIGHASAAVLHDPQDVADRARELGVEPGFEALVKPARQGDTDRREWIYVTKDGGRVHVLLTVTGMRDPDGTLTGFIGIAQDLAERDTAMGQLHAAYDRERSMVAQLNDLADVRSDFVSAVTHDLRTPLTSIRGFAEILLESADDLDAPRRRMLAVVDRNARRLLRMVDDLLTVARMEAGKLNLVMMPVDLATLVDEVCQGFQPEAGRRDLIFEVHADPGALGLVHVDSHHIERVLSNLVSNAVKFTPDGGRVTVDARRHDGVATVTVTDTGVGIPEDELEHLFTRLSRASTATDRFTSGAGLGLTIAKAIVEQHGGTISLTSKAGAGTTVTACFPAVPVLLPTVAAALDTPSLKIMT
ncbi:MAG: PAS domain S-box protein [Actinoplanes sp.]